MTLRRDHVCVLGMRRSGGSVVMAVLEALGLHVGGPLLGPNDFNPRGAWEHLDVARINDAVLESLSASWRTPPKLAPGWERSSAFDELRRAAMTVVERETEIGRWAWKDPRTALILPFWKTAAPPSAYIIAIRCPTDVADSNAHAVPPAEGLDLWTEYVSRALLETAGAPRLVVSYEDVVAEPARQATRIAAFLGMTNRVRSATVRRAITAVVDDDLWHRRTPVDVLAADGAVPPATRAAYAVLRLAAEDADSVELAASIVRDAGQEAAARVQLAADLERVTRTVVSRDETIRRQELALEAAKAAAEPSPQEPAEAPVPVDAPISEAEYERLVPRIRETIATALPAGSTVAVVTKGDGQLLKIEGCAGVHFPRDRSGAWAGYHPATDDDAVAALVAAIASGAEYLAFPRPAMWWLDHYRGLAEHLDDVHALVVDAPDICRIYRLERSVAEHAAPPPAPGLRLDALDELLAELVPHGEQVAVATSAGVRLCNVGSVGATLGDGQAAGGDDIPNARFFVVPASQTRSVEESPALARLLGSRYRRVTAQRYVGDLYERRPSRRLRA